MALDDNATKLASLIDPEVLAPMIEQKMVDLMKFAPLARLDYTLQGRPGSTITLPSYAYIGDAEDVAEGNDIPIAELTQSSVEVSVKKAGKGVQITDEAVLSGYGDPIGEAIDQLGLSVASKTDNDVVAILNAITAPMIHEATGKLTSDEVANALVKFGEDLDGDKVLLIAPEQLAQLRTTEDWIPATDMGVQALMSGVVGMIWGCQVVVSNKIKTTPTYSKTEDEAIDSGKTYYTVTDNVYEPVDDPDVNDIGTYYEVTQLSYANFIVKPGALAIYMKRDTLLETDRDIINKSTVMTVDKHYVAYLYDASKAIKITTKEM
jgi:N4-gp56 family major capsid protein